jgi:hypothetical protein
MKLLDHTVILFLIFLRNLNFCLFFSIAAIPFYIAIVMDSNTSLFSGFVFSLFVFDNTQMDVR